MEARWLCKIIDMRDKVSGEDIGGQALWRRFVKTGIDTTAKEMWDGKD